MKVIKNLLLSMTIVLSVSGVAKAAGVVDQSFIPPSPYTSYVFATSTNSAGVNWIGQTFTTGLTGQLNQLDLAIWKDPAYDTGLVLDIFILNGTSLGSLLGTLTLPSSAVPNGIGSFAIPPTGNVLALSVDLTSLGINVVAGQGYAIATAATTIYQIPFTIPLSGAGLIWLGSSPTSIDNYTGGQQFSSVNTPSTGFTFGPGVDLGFRTYVIPEAVPEPSQICGLIGFGLMGGTALIVRRRRKTALSNSKSEKLAMRMSRA
ncbi:MAG: hypothetical protein H7Y37_18815 [Anaerolineae bacterium]|nr:hypothetical protein [Gloeobacterales cyanobacterium ES-bin-313]